MAAEIKIVDMHNHIIPCVDDGSENDNMSLSMANRLDKQNAVGIIATPHSGAFMQDPEGVRQNYLKTVENLKYYLPHIRVALGCEVFCDEDYMDSTLANLKSGRFPSLNNTRYVLTEFFEGTRPESIRFCVESLLKAGWIPVIAHVERYDYLLGVKDFLQYLRSMGCLLQLNVSSLDFPEMNLKHKWARMLVEAEMIDFVSSDAHDTYRRPPEYSRGLAYLKQACRPTYLEKILWQNAEVLLLNGPPYWEENSGFPPCAL